MDVSSVCVLIITLILTVLSSYRIFLKGLKRKGSKATALKLPPGSMGWPLIGETLQLYSQDPNVFFAAKQKRFVHFPLYLLLSFFLFGILIYKCHRFRYGEIFKTRILGYPCVMLASPEAARFVLVTQAHLFKPTYPKSKERLIGPSFMVFHQGDYHLRLRKLVQGSFSPDALRNLVSGIDYVAASSFDSWDGGRVINVFQEMKKVSYL